MMKLNIAIISPSKGIGGGDRKFKIYFKYLDEKYLNKYLIFITKGKEIKKSSEGWIVGEEAIVKFLKNKKIDFTYVSPIINKKIFNNIKKISTILWNVNFTTIHKEEENVLNLVISKTDYWKISWLKNKKLENTTVIYNPIDYKLWTELAKKQKEKYKFKNKNIKFIIGRLGRAEPTKWHWLMIETLIKLQKKKKNEFGFIFAGMPLLYRLILKLSLKKKYLKNIKFLPELKSHEEISKFYSSINVFWQTSWVGESFGNVIAEAFCFEVPVITDYKDFLKKNKRVRIHKYDAQIEVVDQNENGWVAKYPEIIIKTLEKLTTEEIKKFGKNGRIKVKTTYDAKFAGQTITNILFENKHQKKPYPKNMPNNKEIREFDTEYIKRIKKAKKTNSIKKSSKIKYELKEYSWHTIELGYTLIRKLLRIIKIDLEKL